jgi:osmotically inducible lipoprotein OsmB
MEIFMNSIKRVALLCSAVAAALLASGCASMSECEKHTAAGAAVGGVAGSVLSDGSAAGTVGGAAVGGLIGNQTSRRC